MFGKGAAEMRWLCAGLAVTLTTTLAIGAPTPRTPTGGTAPAKPAPTAPPAFAFRPATLDLAPGETYPVEVAVPSPSKKGGEVALSFTPTLGLSVKPDPRWSGRVGAYGAKTFPKVTAGADAAGELSVTATVGETPSGLRSTVLKVRILPPGIEVIPGIKKLTVRVTNPWSTRLLFGRIVASNPDRFLQDVTTREFRVEAGKTGEVVFPLPGAAPAEGETYDFTLRVETYNGYRSVKKHSLAFPPEPDR